MVNDLYPTILARNMLDCKHRLLCLSMLKALMRMFEMRVPTYTESDRVLYSVPRSQRIRDAAAPRGSTVSFRTLRTSNADRLCVRIDFDDTWRKKFLEFVGKIWWNGCFDYYVWE